MSEQTIAERLGKLLDYNLECERVVFAVTEGEDYEALSSLIYHLFSVDKIDENTAYDSVQDALEAIAYGGCDQADDDSYEIEGDVYNADLIKWLAAGAYNYCWCDDEMEERGEYQSILAIIRDGQAAAKRCVWHAVIGLVRELEEEAE